jgi:hypothetical protein
LASCRIEMHTLPSLYTNRAIAHSSTNKHNHHERHCALGCVAYAHVRQEKRATVAADEPFGCQNPFVKKVITGGLLGYSLGNSSKQGK